MSNAEYIRKYRDTDEVLMTYYQVKDASGKTVNIDGIVNPVKIDNRQLASVTDNQGTTPHCAGYSICNLCEAILWKRTGRLVNLNADQVYAHAKLIDGDVNGEGTYLEAAIKAALKLGGFQNPENIRIGTVNNDRTDATIERVKYLLHKYDFLHVGCEITTGYNQCTRNDPYVKHTNVSCGGHAMLAVGYDQDGLYLQNSWGREWGDRGFAILPWQIFKKEFLYGCYVQGCYDGMKD